MAKKKYIISRQRGGKTEYLYSHGENGATFCNIRKLALVIEGCTAARKIRTGPGAAKWEIWDHDRPE